MIERDILDAVTALHAQFPRLQIDNLVPERVKSPRNTFEQFLSDALANRGQVVRCLEWLALRPRSKTWCKTRDTYEYKHEVERWTGSWISHSSMLVAVQIAGLELRHNPDDPTTGLLKLKSDGLHNTP